MFRLKTAPASEPITVTQAKVFLKVTNTAEDALILNMIKAATKYLEDYTNRSFVTQTWEYYADEFPEEIELYFGSVASITHVKYYNDAGVLTAFTNFQSDLVSNPARLTPSPDYTWPSVQLSRVNAVVVEYITGAAAVDSRVIDAIYLLLGHIYANRQDVVVGHQVVKMPQGSEWLVSSLKLF